MAERWMAVLVDGTRRRFRVERTATSVLVDGNAYGGDLTEDAAIRAYCASRRWAVQDTRKGV